MKKIHSIYQSNNTTIMKTKLSAVLLLFSTILLSGQAPFPNKDEIKQFIASKTCVVLEQDQFSSYNVFIKEAVRKYWTLTPYQLITVQEFNKMRRDPAYSFIVLTPSFLLKKGFLKLQTPSPIQKYLFALLPLLGLIVYGILAWFLLR